MLILRVRLGHCRIFNLLTHHIASAKLQTTVCNCAIFIAYVLFDLLTSKVLFK